MSDIHFVISAPRSGSTWLANALNQHPEIFATEHRLFGNFSEIWRNNDGTRSPRITLDAFIEAFAGHYFHSELGLNRSQFINQFQRTMLNSIVRFAAGRSEKKLIVDKITPYPGTSNLVVRQVKRYFPDARIIQLIRDGRDVLTSGTFDWILKDAHGTDRYLFFHEQKKGFRLRRFFDDDVIQKWAQNWKETSEVFEDESPTLKIKYEEMLADQPNTLCKIFQALEVGDQLEIANSAARKVSFKSTTGRDSGDMVATAKARKGIAGDWKNYFTRIDGQVFHSIAGDQLLNHQYESDPNWFEKLPEELSLVSP